MLLDILKTVQVKFYDQLQQVTDQPHLRLVIMPFEQLATLNEGLDLAAQYAQQKAWGHAKPDQPWTSVLPNGNPIVIVPPYQAQTDLTTWLADLRQAIKPYWIDQRPGIILDGQQADVTSINAALRVLLAYSASLPNYQQEAQVTGKFISVIGTSLSTCRETIAAHQGNAIARYLSLMPPNYLTPAHYMDLVAYMAEKKGWEITLYQKHDLHKMGAGAFCAVASACDKAGIVKLSYQPSSSDQANQAPITLVGKGVCYDTGGLSIKPAQYMQGMHEDMMGSAVALGSFYALTECQPDYPITCYLALTENKIDRQAFLPDSVVTTLAGKTIEITDTDAEGRLILLDTMTLAQQQDKPCLMIDYATLTGTAIKSLDTTHNALFSNHSDWLTDLISIGSASAEKAWPFPLDPSYQKKLKSNVADLKQCEVVGNADHIYAAKLLENFVQPSCRWLHLDLSAGNHDGGLGAIPSDTIAPGVFFTQRLVKHMIG